MSRRQLLTLFATMMVGCSGSGGTAPGQTPAAGGALTGTESVAWDQPAFDFRDLQNLSYLAYVDGARFALTSVSCDTVATPAGFHCVSPLPPLSSGRHTVEFSALGTYGNVQLESARASLSVVVGTNAQSTVTSAPIALASARSARKAAQVEVPLTASTRDGVTFSVEKYVTNLDGPVAMTITADGLLVVVERSQIRIVGGSYSPTVPALTLNDALDRRERGAFVDVTASPDFARTRFLYVLSIAQGADVLPAYRLSRFRELNGVLGERAVLLDGVPVSSHGQPGAVVRFGPDGRLYVAFQDLDDSVAQDLSALNGKILRLAEDGSIPDDNPRRSPVFSYGHAAPSGLAWQPTTGALWETERALSGTDRLNMVLGNRDYGWPDPRLASADAARTRVELGESLDPAGAAFYTGRLIPQFYGDLFFVSRARRALYRVRFDAADPRRVLFTEPLLEDRLGRLGGVVSGPDGVLYVFTSNHDATGNDSSDLDCVFRIVPVS